MKYKLLVSDLDGTLLTEDMKISPENAEAIKKITELGIEFSVSSGRTLHEIPLTVRENPYIRYIAYSNGTALYDKQAGRDVAANRISIEAINEVYDVLSDYDTARSVHVNGRAYVTDATVTDESCRDYQINDYYKEILRQGERIESDEALARSSEGVEAVVIFFRDDGEIEPCRKRLEEISGITVTSSIAHNLELCSDKAGKGEALKMLRDHLGLKGEELIAVGDNMNDVSMFSVAGLSFCAGNGSEGAKALATRVICRSDEHTAKCVYELLTGDIFI